MNKQTDLISRLQDEADLCRNDGAGDIAALLDEAADKIVSLHAELQQARDGLTKGRTRMREDIERLKMELKEARESVERQTLEDAARIQALAREAHTWWTAARDALAQRQSREGVAEDLYGRLESLSKAMECSGRIDEHDHPDAYGAILDAMKYVQADLNVPETQPGATGFDGADAWNAHGA